MRTTGEKIVTAISSLALIISVISVCISIKGCQIEERINYLHMIPEVEIAYVQDMHTDYFILSNKSAIDIVSVSVDYKAYGFEKDKGEYRVAMAQSENAVDDLGERWIYVNKLQPNEKVPKFLGEFTSGTECAQRKLVIARVFNITYYRAKDMMQFKKRVVFFVDNCKVYDYSEAAKDKGLKKAVIDLDPFINKHSDDFRTGPINVKKVEL